MKLKEKMKKPWLQQTMGATAWLLLVHFTLFMHLVIISLIWDLITQMYLILFKTISLWFSFKIKKKIQWTLCME